MTVTCIHTDIQTDSKDRKKEGPACFDPDLTYRLVIEDTALNLGMLVLGID